MEPFSQEGTNVIAIQIPELIPSTNLSENENETSSIELTQPSSSPIIKEVDSEEEYNDDEEDEEIVDEYDDEIIYIEIPKPILKKNPRRFNSGKELYEFLEANKINIKDIE